MFGINLPGVPHKTWNYFKQSLGPGADLARAETAVFPKAREPWHFNVYTTLHAIWVERVCRMDDSPLSQEVHTAGARNLFRRSVRKFRESTYQPDMG